MERAVVLLSGGLDSATCLAIARSRGLSSHCLSFRYGQRHAHELGCAARVAQSLGADEHRIVDIDLAAFGGSSLVGDGVVLDGAVQSAVPLTYVPARNTVFLSFALAWAEVLSATRIFIGANAVDYSGYPDCRPEYIAAFQHMADLATRAGIEGRGPRIDAPLLSLSKAEIISLGMSLGVDFSLTSSCYEPGSSGSPCRVCDSCKLRAKGFSELGVADPLLP